MGKIITATVLFGISLFAFILSARSFMEKGFLLNNAYIYASKKERESMNKKPHYRQSAIVFSFIGLIFLLNGFSVVFEADIIFYVVIALSLIAILYAVISDVLIERNKKEK